MTRVEAREVLMQAIFQMEAQGTNDRKQLELLLVDRKLSKANREYIYNTYEELTRNILTIDDLINRYAVNWNVKRMPKVDLAILRVSIAEMIYTEVPNAIVINEAVNLAKKYGTEDSRKFINGVLGNISRKEL